MAQIPVKTKNGSTIGKIEQLSDGRLKAYATNGSVLGFYDPKANVTKNSSGTVVGKGNCLVTLIEMISGKEAA